MGAPFSLRLVTQPNTTLTTNIGFKPLKEGFFLERKKIVAHKTFYISGSNTGSGVYVLHAHNDSEESCTGSVSPIPYFNNVTKNSLCKSIKNGLQGFGLPGSSGTIFGNNFSVISIPLVKFWDGIKPESLTGSYTDSFKTNTYGELNNNSGYIFYKHGFIIVKNENLTSNSFNLSYKSTREFEEQSILCEIGKNEFNYSTKLGGEVDTQIDTVLYFTTIYFYNDNNEILAIAKLSTPVRKSKTSNFYVNVKFDID